MSTSQISQQHFVPSSDVMTTIVIPTIFFCIAMVVAMLIGINKCKEWELDKIVEIRRTRRVIQRITARLREKNFRTIQKARNIRKRGKRKGINAINPTIPENSTLQLTTDIIKRGLYSTVNEQSQLNPPPDYSTNQTYNIIQPSVGTSPPPPYEESLLDQLYMECNPSNINNVEPLLKTRKRSSCKSSTIVYKNTKNRCNSSASTSSSRY